ncbi:MAG: phytanoyl-CoA dioxygenase family protein [Gemmatimonadota bacterium]|nr:phytanoyl-CoA dioxygenase family protein [Gemmatimonadota bacterium]
MSLSPEQVHLFRHNGFLKLPDRLSGDTVDRLRRAVLEDVRAEVEPVVRNADGRVVRISSLVDRDPVFLETASSAIVLDPLECLMGPNIELVTNRHNHATLNTSAETGPDGFHRDVRQWSRTIFTVIFYLQETTAENGATLLVPGSHHFPGVEGRLYGHDWTRSLLDQALVAPMPEGGMLVIDSLLMHGIGENRTDRTRMSMTVGYHSVDELSDVPNPKRILVRGTPVYEGNDNRSN